MGQQMTNDGAVQTFKEATANQFDGTTNLYRVVKIVPGTENGVAVYDGSGEPIGVNYGKLDDSSDDVSVRLFGCGGTFKVQAGGVIGPGVKVAIASDGDVVARTAETVSIGIKKTFGNSADGDWITVIDLFQEGL